MTLRDQYEDVYRRGAGDTVLDVIDAAIHDDGEMARVRCCPTLSRSRLARYADLLAASASAWGAPAVMDHGCGRAGLARWLAARGSMRAVAVDGAPSVLARARSLLDPSERAWVSLVCADFSSLPFGPASFDGAISYDALYLAADPDIALGELRRVLRPGGLLIFDVLLTSGAAHVLARGYDGGRQPGARSLDEWVALVAAAGFAVEEVDEATDEWRTAMRAKHRQRWRDRDAIMAELGEDGRRHLAVSASMLGLCGGAGVIDATRRFDILGVARSRPPGRSLGSTPLAGSTVPRGGDRGEDI